MNDQRNQTKSFGDLVCVYNRFYVFSKHSNCRKRDSHFYFNLFQSKTRSGVLFSDRNSREAYNYCGGKNPIIVDVDSDNEQQIESSQREKEFKSEQKHKQCEFQSKNSEFEPKIKETAFSQTVEDCREKAEIINPYNLSEAYQKFLNKIFSKQLPTQINMSIDCVNDLIHKKFNSDYKILKITESESIPAVCLLQDECNQSDDINRIPLSELKNKNTEKLVEEEKNDHKPFRSPTEIAKEIVFELIQKVEENLKGKHEIGK